MKEINLTKGQFAIVDDEDFEQLSKYNWHCSYYGYAERAGLKKKGTKRQIIKMHRVIMDAMPGQQIDHINGDKLDNRRRNLRFCTDQQNRYNQKIRTNNKSGLRGVHMAKGRWCVQITAAKRTITIGTFSSKIKAAEAYNAAAKKYHGEFARLNKIEEENA